MEGTVWMMRAVESRAANGRGGVERRAGTHLAGLVPAGRGVPVPELPEVVPAEALDAAVVEQRARVRLGRVVPVPIAAGPRPHGDGLGRRHHYIDRSMASVN